MKIKQFTGLFLCLFLLSSCSTSRLLSSWESETHKSYVMDQVLVIGIAKNETKRRIYEDTFTDSLMDSGINAVASYTARQQPIEPDEKQLREVIRKTNADSVLITHLVSANEKNSYQPHSTIIGTNSYSRGLYGYYPMIYHSVYQSGSYLTKTKVVLETSLYDVKTEERIWTAQTESIDPVMTRKYYQQLIDLFLDDLKNKKLL